jgi:hypothetical protein
VDALFEGKRFGHNTSNIFEALNSKILEERGSLPFQAFQGLARRDAAVFVKRKEEYSAIQCTLHPHLTNKLRTDLALSRKLYRIVQSGDDAFELVAPTKTYVVDLRTKTCSCFHFQDDNLFPCLHAISPIHATPETSRKKTSVR